MVSLHKVFLYVGRFEDCLLCLLDITAKLGVEGLIIAFAVFRADDAESSASSY